MKRNAILTSAVLIALGCSGAASAQDTASQCATRAAQLKTQVEGSQQLADPDRAKLEDSLSEAATADVARCDQIVARVERELGTARGDETAPGATDDDAYSSSRGEPSTEASAADSTLNSGYEEGHASAAQSMPDHPGAAANQADPASNSMADKGYASPNSTIRGNQDQSPTAGEEAANELGGDDEPSMADKGYASPDSTIRGNKDQSPTAGEEAANELGGDTEAQSQTSSDTTSTRPQTPDTHSSAYGNSVSSEGTTGADSSTSSTSSSAGANGKSLEGMTAEDLVNKRVKTADGEDVGEIDSIVTDKSSQDRGYAVIGVGGVLGVGEKKVLVDLDQLHLTADGDVRTSASSERDFDSYPTYDEKNFDKYEGDISRLL